MAFGTTNRTVTPLDRSWHVSMDQQFQVSHCHGWSHCSCYLYVLLSQLICSTHFLFPQRLEDPGSKGSIQQHASSREQASEQASKHTTSHQQQISYKPQICLGTCSNTKTTKNMVPLCPSQFRDTQLSKNTFILASRLVSIYYCVVAGLDMGGLVML